MFESLTKKLFLFILLMLFGLTLVACNNDENKKTLAEEDPLEVFARNYSLHNTEPKIKNFKFVSYVAEFNAYTGETILERRIMYGELYAQYLFYGTLLSYKSEFEKRKYFINPSNYSGYQENITFLYKGNYLYMDYMYILDGNNMQTKTETYGDKNYSDTIYFSLFRYGFSYNNFVDVNWFRREYESITFEDGSIVCVNEEDRYTDKVGLTTYYYDENYQIYKIESYYFNRYTHDNRYAFDKKLGAMDELESTSTYICIELTSKFDFDIPEGYEKEFDCFYPLYDDSNGIF